jgi:hypothetical protein
MHPPILVGEVVPILAIGAFQDDFLSRHMFSSGHQGIGESGDQGSFPDALIP